MKIQQLFLGDENKIEKFFVGANEAFKARSTSQIPYEPLTLEKLIKKIDTGTQAYIMENDAGSIVGGFLAKIQKGNPKHPIMKISCVWVLPTCQGQGIANKMLEHVDLLAHHQKVHTLMLRVASIYEPAVRLYHKYGYKKQKVYANISGTYYFLEMRKQLNNSLGKEIRRIITYQLSMIKFRMLYDTDSTPTKLCKVIYGNGKK